MEIPADPNAQPLSYATGILAQAWGCDSTDATARLLSIATNALDSAGAPLGPHDRAPDDLVDCILRRDLAAFDARIRLACRKVTIADGVYVNTGDYHRHGFQDDGPLRTAQAQAKAAHAAAAQSTVEGLLAAVNYAEATTAICRRKQTLLKIRPSASFFGYQIMRKRADGSADVPPSPRRPLWKRIVIGAILGPLSVLAAPYFAAVWLVEVFVE
jgi:hypothetical protein